MRSYHPVKPPSTLNFFLTLLLLIFPLASSYNIAHVWKRDAWSTQPNKGSVDDNSGFQDLGHIDTTHHSTSVKDEEAAAPSATILTPSPPGPDTLNTTALGNEAPSSTCSSLESWYVPNLDTFKGQFITDCYLAVQRLYIDDVHFNAKSNSRIEFVAPPGSNGLPAGFKHTTTWGEMSQETPVMFEANTCTLAIIMLSTFVNMTGGTTDLLPGNFKQPGSMKNWDVSTFRTLHRTGRMVENDCLRRWGRGGWMAAGEDKNIGVFLWATNSTIDLKIRPAMEEQHVFSMIGSGKGTSEQQPQPVVQMPPQQQPAGVLTGTVNAAEGGNATSPSASASSSAHSAVKPGATGGGKEDETAPRRRRKLAKPESFLRRSSKGKSSSRRQGG